MVVVGRLVGRDRRAGAGVDRGPYIGGSQNNSVLELTLGYNGLGRLTGDETGSVGGGGRPAAAAGARPGWLRLFDAEIGGQVAWLLPAALILLVAGLVADLAGAAHRPDPGRAAALGRLAAGHRRCLQPHAGIFHAYYTVALAPAIGALVGIGAVALVAAAVGGSRRRSGSPAARRR